MFSMLKLLILLLWQLCRANLPLRDEIKAGFVYYGLPTWGHLARTQDSMRILCIGGSNTANGHYVGYLIEYLQSNVSYSAHFKNTSYALNRGISGHSAMSFIGRMYDFEFNETSTWPNIVVIDTSVNFNYRKIVKKECGQVLESLVKSIEFKYRLNHLETPDFMFFNMPHFAEVISASNKLVTAQQRIEFVKNYTTITDSRESLAGQILAFAQHYHYPVISWHVAMTPAVLRYFVSVNVSFDEEPYPYLSNDVHMSDLGSLWGVENLLVPFFREAMLPRDESASVPVVSRLHPPRPTLIEVLSYHSFWGDYGLQSLSEVTYNTSSTGEEDREWHMLPLRHNDACYGSTVKGSEGEVHFVAPTTCSSDLTCRVQVSFLHSWNDSYVGNTSCILRRHSVPKGDISELGRPLFIDGQSGVESHTFSVKSLFNANITDGLHSVRCTALVNDRLSCMHGLDVNAVIIL